MATFNGAKYINDQLKSISNQSIVPSEVIICDDNSTDETVIIIKKFIDSTSMNVRLFKNKKTMGFSQNFGKALGLCKGEYIFLCDQDDVWFSNKIERMLDVIEKNQDKYVFYNDAEFTDSDLVPKGQTKLNKQEKTNKNLNGFLQGSCCVIKREFLNQILPIPIEVKAHDIWIGWLARIFDVKYVRKETLQYYRQHHDNNSNNKLNKSLNMNKYYYMYHTLSNNELLNNLNSSVKLLFLCKNKVNNISESNVELFNNQIIHNALKKINKEIDLIQKRIYLKQKTLISRFFHSSSFLIKGNYNYFNGSFSYIKDIFFNKF